MGRAPGNTREKLIETATELMWRSSYGTVSVDDICKAAGVKKGSFYHFFPSKAELAVAVMEHYFDGKKPLLDAAFSPTVPPVQRFHNLCDAILHKQREAFEKYGIVCGCPLAAMGSEMAGVEEAIRAKSDEMCSRHRMYIETALRDMVADGGLPAGTDIKAKSGEIESHIMGCTMMARIQNDLTPLDRDIRVGVMRILGVDEKAEAAKA